MVLIIIFTVIILTIAASAAMAIAIAAEYMQDWTSSKTPDQTRMASVKAAPIISPSESHYLHSDAQNDKICGNTRPSAQFLMSPQDSTGIFSFDINIGRNILNFVLHFVLHLHWMCGNILDFKAYFVGKKRKKNRLKTKEKSVKPLKTQRFYAFLHHGEHGIRTHKRRL